MTKKPYPDFPLTYHPRGYWVKVIRGKQHRFGRVEDGWEAALERYKAEVDDLKIGRTPQREEGGKLTLDRLCNLYLDSAEARIQTGEMKSDTYADYKRTAEKMLAVIGRQVAVESLRAPDFERLRVHLVESFALLTVAGHIQRVKTMLRWGYEHELIDKPVRTGPQFRKPSAALLRRERAARPVRLFTRDEVAWLVEHARGAMRPMILLGINAALGNRDCGELKFRHLDLAGGWITYPRPKTGIDRRAKLWPETVKAIEHVLAKRKEPHDPELADRVFLTKYRTAWAKEGSRDSPVSKEMFKLMERGEMAKGGRSFYSLRHSFRTIADEIGDHPAVGYVMGHVDASIAGVYRGRIDDARLERVAEYVRAWLFPPPTPKNKAARKKAKPKAKHQE